MGKLFGTDGVRGVANIELTCRLAWSIGKAAAQVLAAAGESGRKPRVIIGKDTRISGDMLENALAAGFNSVGADVELIGVVPTPAVAYLVKEMDADAGAMISASHNPYEYNGIKLFNREGYKLADEDQPFGLRWFIPEFLKLKGLFGQIAMAVLMINAIALITPLFFQIVVDKVLVNNTYQTLNVLGVGIVAAILFNACLEYLRNYLLLFATNKIDISTATKTFKHLMRLPIEFFERVPSGVLLKHMQQTEKIRGFLSGNLFFTVLELFSLVVFIPFLLLYSVELTLVVLGYSVLMALVIALLIKPFQSRLNELYQAEDAEVLLVGYGISGRLARTAVDELRAQGIRAGLLRPITLFPFPVNELRRLPAKQLIAVEMSCGQMIDDVKLAINCDRPVHLINRMGGNIPGIGEIVERTIKLISAEEK